MTWAGVNLSEDQRAVSDMVLEWREPLAPLDTDDDAAAETARAGIVELGVWSMGMPETVGGDDAAIDLRVAALAALGGRFAALAWACAQAHAAAEVLAGARVRGELLPHIVAGKQAVAVVDLGSVGVQLTIDGGRASGTIARIDAGGAEPALVILDGDDTAWLLEPSAIRAREAHRRTGFAGARTSSAVIDGTVTRISDVAVSGVRARLRLAGAAIAAGVALDAAALAADYASSRVQFGGPLTALPTVRRSLDQQRRRAVLSLSAAVCDDGESLDRATGALAQNLGRAIEVAADALQSHGGYGYIEEYGVARLLRDAVSLRAATSMI
ncbi:acyl-CoA dehydrogenase family protein [Salinibacterium sp. GXW1014]|uniref:acyl-CoA dehydrogenase family protein n=1 Tax=Salinibacterium sp. GXW1014 TaxID=3377838 RepID=UPI00383AEA83